MKNVFRWTWTRLNTNLKIRVLSNTLPHTCITQEDTGDYYEELVSLADTVPQSIVELENEFSDEIDSGLTGSEAIALLRKLGLAPVQTLPGTGQREIDYITPALLSNQDVLRRLLSVLKEALWPLVNDVSSNPGFYGLTRSYRPLQSRGFTDATHCLRYLAGECYDKDDDTPASGWGERKSEELAKLFQDMILGPRAKRLEIAGYKLFLSNTVVSVARTVTFSI